MAKILFIVRFFRSLIGDALYLQSLRKRFPGVIFRANISIVENGKNLTLGSGTEIAQNTFINCGGQKWSEYKGYFKCGKQCYIGPNSVIFAAGEIEMGDCCLLWGSINLMSFEHSFIDKSKPYALQPNQYAKITIGNNVCIGANTTVTRGVTIGDNAVIEANSFIDYNVPANAVVAKTKTAS